MHCARTPYMHLCLANANLSCKGSKEMARRLHQHLSAQSTPTSSGQRQSRSAPQRSSSTIKNPASTATNRRQHRIATTRSQQPPSRPLTRRTERRLVEDEDAEDRSGDDSDDHRRRHPRIRSPTSAENTSPLWQDLRESYMAAGRN